MSSIFEKAHHYEMCCKAENSVIVGARDQSSSSLRGALYRTRGRSVRIAPNIAEDRIDVEVSQRAIFSLAEDMVRAGSILGRDIP
jgi:hypothetical protein